MDPRTRRQKMLSGLTDRWKKKHTAQFAQKQRRLRQKQQLQPQQQPEPTTQPPQPPPQQLLQHQQQQQPRRGRQAVDMQRARDAKRQKQQRSQRQKQLSQRRLTASADSKADSDLEDAPPASYKRKVAVDTVDVAVQTDVVQQLQRHQMSHGAMMQMQMSAHLSGRQMMLVCRDVRRGTNDRTIFSPHFRDVMVHRNKMFAPYFTVKTMRSDELECDIHGVFCHDVRGLLQHLERLHHSSITKVHLGADSGQSFLKVDFTIEFGERDPDAPPISELDADIDHHSRRRVIVVACVPIVKENYANLEYIFNTIGFPPDAPFIFVGDLKLDNLVLGLAAPGARAAATSASRS